MGVADRDGWREHLKAQVASGLTGAAYCRERGIPEKTFHYWRRKAKEENAEGRGRFVKVTGSPEPIRITRGAVTIEISATSDPQTLRRVLEALDARD